jgi:uncharacterized membrane protein
MPGPGGGSRGGGGHGGGFGGGGFRGGGHGGGHRGGFYGGGFYPRPYRRYGFFGYGYGGGCLSALMMPFILLFMAIIIIVSLIGGAFGSISEGGITDYEERVFQEYADSEYRKAFGASTAYEDNILIVFLTNEDADEYYYIAWVGDHVAPDVNNMFGNNYTELGAAMNESINTSGYWYSLDSNLALMLDKMADKIEALDVDNSFTCNESHVQVDSKLINYGTLNLSEQTVNTALNDFTERTGISISIVVNDMDEIFGVDYSSMITGIFIVAILVGISVFMIVKYIRNRKHERDGDEFYNNYKNQNGNW